MQRLLQFRFVGLSQIASIMFGAAGLIACTASILPPVAPPSAPADAALFDCPIVPAQVVPPPGACNTILITGAKLTCGGNGKLAVATSTIPTGGTQFEAVLSNFSVYSATFYPINNICNVGIGVPIEVTLGVTYMGNQGAEPTLAGPVRECIVQSRADFAQFHTTDPLITLFEETAKEEIHRNLDDALINALFTPTGASPVAGRCMRWRLLAPPIP